MNKVFSFAVLALAALQAGAQVNPLERFAANPSSLATGRWNGVDLERRSNCSNTLNNGTHGTYAQFDVATDPAGNFRITQLGITGLNCVYEGRYQSDGRSLSVQGAYSCTDGKQGNFQSSAIDVSANTLTIHLGVQLTTTETCSIQALLNMARF